ncbi:MAG TPA: glycosyltransferase [Anaerolineae bacterium]|nr:glycosyltransferase [Anaerolineae bacterium]
MLMFPSNPLPLNLRVSVIIPAYNAEKELARCLMALEYQTLPQDEYEVIVVDDGSQDGTADVAKAHGARVLKLDHMGPAAARNAGAELARADIIVFTDADCEPAPDFLERLIEPFDAPLISGTRGVYRTQQTSLVARFVQLEYEERYQRIARLQKEKGSVDALDTSYAAYRREVFLEAGGFDTRYRHAAGEDHELSFRLAHAGHTFRFVPDAAVYHWHVETMRQYARRKFRIGYWKAFLSKQHPEYALHDSHTTPSLKIQIALAALLPFALVGWIFSPAFGWLALALAMIFLLSTFSLLKLIYQRDKPVLLIALPMLLIRAYASGLGFFWGLVHGPTRSAQETPVLHTGSQ